VVLVDDQRPVLDAVSAMLAHDFDVVGVATDGRRALDTMRRLHADVVVLDIDMPGVDGFQTCRALERWGLSDIPVVFLSSHAADDMISEAFRIGGLGYVLKSRVTRDLLRALDEALAGRRFVPSPTALLGLPEDDTHAVQLYHDEEPYLDGLAMFVDRALQRGDATCIIETGPVREGLSERLSARRWDVGGPLGHPRYRWIDPAEALDRFLRNGMPDRDRLAEIVVELDQYRRAVAEGETPRLTVCGSFEGPLIAEGNTRAVIAVERLWDTLTRGLPIVTLCTYAASWFHDGVPGFWSDVCSMHTALSHASDV
jgi:CheY-like chemotaxis protein